MNSRAQPMPFGNLLRQWRQRRRMSQLALACEADISTRHLLLRSPVNVLRLSLHPGGLAPRIANLAQWRAHLLARLRQQIDASGDAVLVALHEELAAYPSRQATHESEPPGVAVPFQLVTPAGTLSFISTTTIFGTPVDITLSELALESFFPADAATAQALRAPPG